MGIRIQKTVTIDGHEYQLISDALELARRYISEKAVNNHDGSKSVGEYTSMQLIEIEKAMDRYWS